MQYFVTGGTGFIGRYLLAKLLARSGVVYVLTRESSLDKIEALRDELGTDDKHLIAVVGDLSQANLGVSSADIKKLAKTDHFFHLAAIYDIKASAEAQSLANTQGTQEAINLAKKIKVGCFHHVSSIAAAGLYPGSFSEEMFEQATNLINPYFTTKHDSEGLVRAEDELNWRIYRPGIVLGHSQTGHIDKIDGPYYFFNAINSLSQSIPSWLHSLMLGAGQLNLVPVDYVVDGLDYLAHYDKLNKQCFYLTQPKETSIGDMLQQLLAISGGPKLTVMHHNGGVRKLLDYTGKSLNWLRPVRKFSRYLLEQYDIPQQVLPFITYPTHFDSRKSQAILAQAGIHCPDFDEYAQVIWDYWYQHYAAAENTQNAPKALAETVGKTIKDLPPKKLHKAVVGRTVLVSGATSGIGEDVALKLARAGAKVILVARGEQGLIETQARIKAEGGRASYYPCDLSSEEDCQALIQKVNDVHGGVDILINNAGRSIRRSVAHSFERFHDFERTMQLNYFGSLKLILGFAPQMLQQGYGHIINISSIGVLASPPRFSAYVASKAALDAFSQCAAAEFAHRNVSFTTINMPLVATPMIAPTKLYQAFPTLTPDQASDLVCKAITHKPKRIASFLGVGGAVAQAVIPKTSEFLLNQAFHIFPDSNAAMGKSEDQSEEQQDVLAVMGKVFSQFSPGVHW